MRIAIAVPCFNEAARLDGAKLLELVHPADVHVELVLVDDGSSDGTRALLEGVVARATGRARLLSLPANVGKGEAVRAGMNDALARGADAVGYFDADLATPPAEMLRVVRALVAAPAVQVALGSRVRVLGSAIERSAARHYVGRVFATAASLLLRAPVYDTQCGAKVFRATPALAASLTAPFVSRWAFDVELLARLLHGPQPVPLTALVEVPLHAWREVPGGTLGPAAMLRAAADLVAIARTHR